MNAHTRGPSELGLDQFVLDAFETYNNRIENSDPNSQQSEESQLEAKANQFRDIPDDGGSLPGDSGVSLPEDSDVSPEEENIFNFSSNEISSRPAQDISSVPVRLSSPFQLYKDPIFPVRKITNTRPPRQLDLAIPRSADLFTNNTISGAPQQAQSQNRRIQPQSTPPIRGRLPARGRMVRNKKTGREHFHDVSLQKPRGYEYIKADDAKDARGFGFTDHERRALVRLANMPYGRPMTEAEIQFQSFLMNPIERGDPEENRMAKALGFWL